MSCTLRVQLKSICAWKKRINCMREWFFLYTLGPPSKIPFFYIMENVQNLQSELNISRSDFATYWLNNLWYLFFLPKSQVLNLIYLLRKPNWAPTGALTVHMGHQGPDLMERRVKGRQKRNKRCQAVSLQNEDVRLEYKAPSNVSLWIRGCKYEHQQEGSSQFLTLMFYKVLKHSF